MSPFQVVVLGSAGVDEGRDEEHHEPCHRHVLQGADETSRYQSVQSHSSWGIINEA